MQPRHLVARTQAGKEGAEPQSDSCKPGQMQMEQGMERDKKKSNDAMEQEQ